MLRELLPPELEAIPPEETDVVAAAPVVSIVNVVTLFVHDTVVLLVVRGVKTSVIIVVRVVPLMEEDALMVDGTVVDTESLL